MRKIVAFGIALSALAGAGLPATAQLAPIKVLPRSTTPPGAQQAFQDRLARQSAAEAAAEEERQRARTAEDARRIIRYVGECHLVQVRVEERFVLLDCDSLTRPGTNAQIDDPRSPGFPLVHGKMFYVERTPANEAFAQMAITMASQAYLANRTVALHSKAMVNSEMPDASWRVTGYYHGVPLGVIQFLSPGGR